MVGEDSAPLGFEVGRYISLERLIEQNKERYYETLGQGSMMTQRTATGIKPSTSIPMCKPCPRTENRAGKHN